MMKSLTSAVGVRDVLVFSCVLLVCMLIKIAVSRRKKSLKPPPGPMGLPLIGYIPFLSSLPFLKFQILRRRYGDVFSIKMGSRNCVVINGLGTIKEMLSLDDFSDRPSFMTLSIINEGKSLAFKDGGSPGGKLHRKICLGALSRFVNSTDFPLQHMLHDVSRYMINQFLSTVGKPTTPHDIIRDGSLSVIFKICFGRSVDIEKDQHFFNLRRTLDEFLIGHQSIFAVDFIPSLEGMLKNKIDNFKRITQDYQSMMQEILDEHQQSFHSQHINDAADALIQSCEKHAEQMQEVNLTRREVLHSVQDFIGAGSQTTGDFIIWFIALLVMNPDVQEKIHHEIMMADLKNGAPIACMDFSQLPYLHACIFEVGRVRPVSPLAIPHATNRDTSFRGYDIPKGTMIIPNFCSVHLDETLYPNPQLFRPERFLLPDGSLDNELVANMPMFGVGRRRCIGRMLAEREILYFMCELLRELRFMSVPGELPTLEGELSMTWAPNRFLINVEKRCEVPA